VQRRKEERATNTMLNSFLGIDPAVGNFHSSLVKAFLQKAIQIQKWSSDHIFWQRVLKYAKSPTWDRYYLHCLLNALHGPKLKFWTQFS
jgi:preprotein translocase subunit Sss1